MLSKKIIINCRSSQIELEGSRRPRLFSGLRNMFRKSSVFLKKMFYPITISHIFLILFRESDTLMTRTTRSRRTNFLAAGSLLLVFVLAMAIFSSMATPLHIISISTAFAQGSNMAATGNQTNSPRGDAAQGDPDGDGL